MLFRTTDYSEIIRKWFNSNVNSLAWIVESCKAWKRVHVSM